MEPLIVDLKERSYPIIFEDSFLKLPRALKERKITSKILIVTDSNVNRHFGDQVLELLKNHGFQVYRYAFKAGEKSKILATVTKIYDSCIQYRLDRNDTIIALGGGVVGDIAGFAAASYMRGIRFVQVPTSLLAQVDSSVGGKVGVDYKGNKNMIGAFYQPALVYINTESLRTLPEREFISGLAEIIKHSIIFDAPFFDYIEQKIDAIRALDMTILKDIIRKNCSIKAQIVQQDEREQNLRAILNFGHTIGHGVESALYFSLLHGECVSIGICAVSYIANRLNVLSDEDYKRMVKLLKRAGLPVGLRAFDSNSVYEAMLHDKKQIMNKLKFILPVQIGKVIQTTDITKEDIFSALEQIRI